MPMSKVLNSKYPCRPAKITPTQPERCSKHIVYPSGNYAARSKGIKRSGGKFIFMMDADDIVYSNRILTQMSAC
ncbi:glycosyltransferase family A protein [Pedobacter riviphilus]|uniref:glycosyltransferase family A protein n=1 Tax=Pedobacter riviphilus TaxID=2766984 RepID=UPI0038B3A3DE